VTPPPPPPASARIASASSNGYTWIGWSDFFRPPAYPNHWFVAGLWSYYSASCTGQYLEYEQFYFWDGRRWQFYAQLWLDQTSGEAYNAPPC
jgi:hypothetical protein